MHKDILLDAQLKTHKQPIMGFAIRCPRTGTTFAWFKEESTAHTYAQAVRARGATVDVVAVIGVLEERLTPSAYAKK